MNKSELKANTCNRHQAWKKVCKFVTIDFGFTPNILVYKVGQDFFSESQGIAMQNQSNCKTTLTQLKTVLIAENVQFSMKTSF